jgi:hypothetical protein
MKCVYCGSSSYGKDCMFSPVKSHAHMDEPDKCIYCGSNAYGGGCMFNPYGDMHVKSGILFQNVKEQLKKSAILSHLFEMLEQKNILNYNSPLDRFYKRMAQYIKNFSEPFLESFLIREKPIFESIDLKTNKKIYEHQIVIKKDIEKLKESIKNANLELSTEIVEKVILDAIIDSCD